LKNEQGVLEDADKEYDFFKMSKEEANSKQFFVIKQTTKTHTTY
jgi:hypothetical protein